MGNAPSSRPWLFRRPRLLALAAGGVVAALVLAGTLTIAALNLHHVHASGTGGGGGGGSDCFYYTTTAPTPACTFSGHNGWAQVQSNSGCVFTDIGVFASDNFSRTGANTTQGSYLSVEIFTYNNCTGYYISSGWGDDAAGTVQFSATANSLTARDNIEVQTYSPDGTSSTATYTVDLTWKYIGSPIRSESDYHYQAPTFVTSVHYTGTGGNAIVSGTLSDGTTNFAATPSTDAEWLNADSGTFVTIQK